MFLYSYKYIKQHHHQYIIYFLLSTFIPYRDLFPSFKYHLVNFRVFRLNLLFYIQIHKNLLFWCIYKFLFHLISILLCISIIVSIVFHIWLFHIWMYSFDIKIFLFVIYVFVLSILLQYDYVYVDDDHYLSFRLLIGSIQMDPIFYLLYLSIYLDLLYELDILNCIFEKYKLKCHYLFIYIYYFCHVNI